MRKHHDVSKLTRRNQKSAQDSLPVRIILLSVILLTLLFYQLVIQIPRDLGGRASGEGPGELCAAGLESVSLYLGAHPIAGFCVFMVLLSPGLVFYRQSRPYFHSLILGALLLSGVTFIVSKQPAERLGAAIHQMSTERELSY